MAEQCVDVCCIPSRLYHSSQRKRWTGGWFQENSHVLMWVFICLKLSSRHSLLPDWLFEFGCGQQTSHTDLEAGLQVHATQKPHHNRVEPKWPQSLVPWTSLQTLLGVRVSLRTGVKKWRFTRRFSSAQLFCAFSWVIKAFGPGFKASANLPGSELFVWNPLEVESWRSGCPLSIERGGWWSPEQSWVLKWSLEPFFSSLCPCFALDFTV